MSTLNARSALVNRSQTSTSGMFINVVDSASQKDTRRQVIVIIEYAQLSGECEVILDLQYYGEVRQQSTWCT